MLIPEIKRWFQYQTARHEPFKLVRYGGDGPGYFRPRRDTVTRDTARRRFAMTLNLSYPDTYTGGQLRFPEHSPAFTGRRPAPPSFSPVRWYTRRST